MIDKQNSNNNSTITNHNKVSNNTAATNIMNNTNADECNNNTDIVDSMVVVSFALLS